MPKLYKAPFYTEEQLEELEENEMCFPYSDKYLTYDSIKRQYVPTEALLLKHGINLNEFLMATGDDSPANVNIQLEFISDQIYSYINKNSGSSINVLKWMIAKGIKMGLSPYRFRLLFEEIIWKQARFYVDNDDPTKSTGIDIEQKQWLNKGVLVNEDRHIDPKVKIMLMDLGLCWAGSYDNQFGGLVAQNNW